MVKMRGLVLFGEGLKSLGDAFFEIGDTFYLDHGPF